MHGLFRTAAFVDHATPAASCVLAALTAAFLAACSSGPERHAPARPWKIADFQIMSDGSDGCTGVIGPVLGTIASMDLSMPGQSLKLAAGCRADVGGTEFGAIVELRVPAPDGRNETIDAMELSTATGSGGDADMTWGVAVFKAIGHAAAVRDVTSASDVDLCAILENPETERDVLMRSLEEAAIRGRCPEVVGRIALDADEDLALRAVGTLGRIGAPESITTLGRLTLSKNPGMPWAAAHAIADIGGADAARALDIIADQADTIELRVQARKLAKSVRDRNGAR